MAVSSLVKGGNVSLTKEAPTMNVAMVGLGWDARVTDGQGFDLDASVFAVGEDGKVLSDAHFIFFNNKTSPDGAVEHQGDNRTGEGDGDDEQVKIDLTKVSADIKKKLVFFLLPLPSMMQKRVNKKLRHGEQQLHARLQQRQRDGNCPFRSV